MSETWPFHSGTDFDGQHVLAVGPETADRRALRAPDREVSLAGGARSPGAMLDTDPLSIEPAHSRRSCKDVP